MNYTLWALCAVNLCCRGGEPCSIGSTITVVDGDHRVKRVMGRYTDPGSYEPSSNAHACLSLHEAIDRDRRDTGPDIEKRLREYTGRCTHALPVPSPPPPLPHLRASPAPRRPAPHHCGACGDRVRNRVRPARLHSRGGERAWCVVVLVWGCTCVGACVCVWDAGVGGGAGASGVEAPAASAPAGPTTPAPHPSSHTLGHTSGGGGGDIMHVSSATLLRAIYGGVSSSAMANAVHRSQEAAKAAKAAAAAAAAAATAAAGSWAFLGGGASGGAGASAGGSAGGGGLQLGADRDTPVQRMNRLLTSKLAWTAEQGRSGATGTAGSGGAGGGTSEAAVNPAGGDADDAAAPLSVWMSGPRHAGAMRAERRRKERTCHGVRLLSPF